MNFDTPLALFQHLLAIDEDNMATKLLTLIDERHEFYTEVTTLIAAHEENKKQTSFNDLIGKQAEQLVEDSAIHELLNSQISVYKLTKKLGQGGMGAVYLGERNDGQLEQKVAIKFVYPSIAALAGNDFLSNEAQHLANLKHANITQIFTVDKTKESLPYMVMEYVEGLPIDRYSKENKLNFNERLELLRKVCSAVQAAHQNMIIHADIKPSNILVNSHGEPKLMDFGIARRFSYSSDEKLIETSRLRAMSRDFSSAEQLRGESLTSACDVFSLAKNMQLLLDSYVPSKLVKKELNCIIEKCLDENPSERLSISQLITHIDNLNKNKSVDLYSTNWIYNLRKFSSRNRALSLISTAAVVLLCGSVVNLIYSINELERQSNIASESLEFLEGSLMKFGVNDLNHDTVKSLIAARISDIGEVKSAEVKAKLGYVFGRLSSGIDEFDTSIDILKKSANFFADNEQYYEQIRSLNSLSQAIQKKGDAVTAMEVMKDALKIALTQNIDDQIPTLNNNIGGAYFTQNEYENAYKYYSAAVANIDKVAEKGDYFGDIAMLHQNLASAAGQLDKASEAEEHFKIAQKNLLKSPEKNLGQRADLDAQLGFFYLHQKKYEQAKLNLNKALESTIEIYGEEHTNVAFKSYNLAKTYMGIEQYAEAQPLIEKAEKIFIEKFGEQDYRVAIVRNGLADNLFNQGKHNKALNFIDMAIPVLTSFFGADHTRTTDAMESKENIEKAIKISDI